MPNFFQKKHHFDENYEIGQLEKKRIQIKLPRNIGSQ